MMTKRRLVFLIGVIGIFAFLQYDLNKRAKIKELSRAVAQKSQTPVAAQTGGAAEVSAQASPEGNKTEIFLKRFKAEVAEIGRTQADPDLAQNRMKTLAADMGQKEIEALAQMIMDENHNADERAMAVELLTIKNDAPSLLALQNLVVTTNKVSEIKTQQKKEFETILRAQAVEGIATFPDKDIALSKLSFLQTRVDNPFINERISRAAAGLMYGGETLQQQDDDALKKLVE